MLRKIQLVGRKSGAPELLQNKREVGFEFCATGLGSLTQGEVEAPTPPMGNNPNSSTMLILSGGEGYIDFRIGELLSISWYYMYR